MKEGVVALGNATAVSEPEYLLIVRREVPEKLAYLTELFGGDPRVRVIVDRRVRDRRQGTTPVPVDRRREDRRRPAPRSWTLADYILVPTRPDADPRRI